MTLQWKNVSPGVWVAPVNNHFSFIISNGTKQFKLNVIDNRNNSVGDIYVKLGSDLNKAFQKAERVKEIL